MNLEEAKKLIGDIIEFEVGGNSVAVYVGKLQYIFETHELGKTKITLQFTNERSLIDGYRGSTKDFKIEEISKYRVIDGTWKR